MERDIEDILTRGVGTFIDPEGAFKEKLLKKARGEYKGDIVIKLGIDPTRPDIHLGFAVVLRKLRQFQNLGCKVVFLVGDFTARIGDPSGKSKVRPELEQAEVERNAKTYIEQVGKILRTDDPHLFAWIRNSDWFTNISDLNLPDNYEVNMDVKQDGKSVTVPIPPNSTVGKAIVFEQSRMQKAFTDAIHTITLHTFLWTLRKLTHARLIERDMFQDRINSGTELFMHEMMYPVLQGIDSYAIAKVFRSCDLEVGGTDQTFNMIMGRDVMKANGVEPQAVLSFDILPGLDGKEKMSKSLDNYIAITESPSEMYGKVMSIPDNVMSTYFLLTTYTPVSQVEEIEKKLESGDLHPKEVKMRLAREIVTIYHGEAAAKQAEEDFVETFSNKGLPSDIPSVTAEKGTKLVDVLIKEGIVDSKTEWRRLVTDGAVSDAKTGETVTSPDMEIDTAMTLKIGKRRFITIELS